jgi:hypothetical protein
VILFHGGTDIVKLPQILLQTSGRDFGRGFYCTDLREQAEKWALRQGRIRKQDAVLNTYNFNLDDAKKSVSVKMFNDYSMEWLELIINCRKILRFTHGYDIVYGKIANDDVGETVQAVVDGLMSPDFALQKLVFMPANNQYSFCTEKSFEFLKFVKSEKVL